MSDVAFDYTARSFDTIREELRLLLLRQIPEWVDTPSSFEGVLMDQMAYVGDVLNFYVDRLGSEAYLQTAVRRESLLNIAYMLGYVPTAQTAAKGTVTFVKVPTLGNVTVPARTQVFAQLEGFDPIIFETTEDRVITGASAEIDVEEGVTVTEELLGRSTGATNQVYGLFNNGVIKDSVRVFTRDGNVSSQSGQPTLSEWTFTERIIDGEFYERAFSLFTDSEGFMNVRFGDGVSGAIPNTGVEIYATYRYGYGVDGNIASGAIRSLAAGGDLAGRVQSVNNSAPMQGGADAESIDSMRSSIPRSLRAVERAVTREDFQSLAVRVGGVAKASANPASSVTTIQLAVAPVGGGAPTAQLLTDVETYLGTRKMLGVDVVASAPTYVAVNSSISIQVDSRYRNDEVRSSVITAMEELYAFDNQEFGARVTKADIFQAVVRLEGVEYVEITAFNTDGIGDDGDFTLAYDEIAELGALTTNATGGIAAV